MTTARRRPPIDRRQQDGWSCGAVAAAVALDLIGWSPGDVAAVRNAIPATPIDGTDPRTLEGVLRRAGCHVQSGEMDHDDLVHHADKGRPVLCLIQFNGVGHWVTVYAASSRLVQFHCPTAGCLAMYRMPFGRVWYDTDRAGAEYRRFGLAVIAGGNR